MIVFPNAKINLGLQVLRKRNDGFHDINTVFYAVNWCDILEVNVSEKTEKLFDFKLTGLTVNGAIEDNLIYQAWSKININHTLPPLYVHLHKNIPMGAGLGGGSADAAFFINAVNDLLALNMPLETRLAIASELGSDCAFFILNQPVFATGRGTEFSPLSIRLKGYYFVIVYPSIHSNTREAYGGLTPHEAEYDLKSTLAKPIHTWRSELKNDFEATIFKKYPLIAALKNTLYEQGALYACMSGSGSALFGIFDHEPQLTLPDQCIIHISEATC